MPTPPPPVGTSRPLPTAPRLRHRPAPGVLRQRAEQAIRARHAPTTVIGVRGDEDGPNDQQAREVVDLALRVGEALLGTGASASDVTGTVLRLVRAYGVHSVHVDVSYSSLTISYHRGPFRDPMSVMRVVPSMSADYTRLEAIQALVRRVVDSDEPGEVRVAREALDRIITAHHPYRRSVVTLALAVLGAAVAALLGGGGVLMVLSAVSAAVVDRVQRFVSLAGIPAFFSQALGAAIPTGIAVLLWTVAGWTGSATLLALSPSVVVATGVVVLLAGLSVVSSAQDTLDGYYLTAAGRAFEVVVLSAGVVAGVLGVLSVATRMDAPIVVSVRPIELSGNVPVEILCAFAVAAAHCVACYTGPRGVLFSGLVGAAGWGVFRLGTQVLDVTLTTATGLAALAVGVLAQGVAVPFRVPALAVTTGGIVPLLPGLAVFRGLLEMVQSGPTQTAVASLVAAATVGMAIAGGVSLGSLPARRAYADRVQQRLQRRAAGDSRD